MQVELVGDFKSMFTRGVSDVKSLTARKVRDLFKRSDTAMPQESLPVAVGQTPSGFLPAVPRPVLYGGVAVVALLLLGVFKRRG